MDRGDRPGTHPAPVGQEPRAVNGAALPEALELHTTKAFETGNATFPGGHKALARGGISKDRPPGEAGESADILGGRDRDQQPGPGGAELRAEGANTGGQADREED